MNLFEAIAAGDEDALREELERNPESAGERNADGLSPVLFALYNGRADLVDPILDANPALDVFDAAAVGRTRGLEELLEAEPRSRTLAGRTARRRFTWPRASTSAAPQSSCSSTEPTRPRATPRAGRLPRSPSATRASYSAPASRPGSSRLSWR